MTTLLFTIGFISILGQVVILRELNVAFYGVELIYILAIGLWLLWTATGALIGRRTFAPSPATVGWLSLLFAVLLPADVCLIRCSRVLLGGVPGAFLPFGLQLLAAVAALLPVGVLLGLMFQWAAKLYIGRHRTLAMSYAIESAGGLLGGLASTLLLRAGMQNFAIAVLCGLVAAAVVVRPLAAMRRAAPAAAALLVIILGILLWRSPGIDQQLTRVGHPNLVESRDSPYGRITITRQGDQVIVLDNDALGFETESVAAEELVHLPAANVSPLERILILGGGIGGLVHEALKHSPAHVDYVELNPVLLRLGETHLPQPYATSLHSPRVAVHTADPRTFVRNGGSYDLIIVGMPDPTSGQSNRFYTREFFRQCNGALAPDGVLALRLRSSENVWTQFVTYRNTSVCRALESVFRNVVVLPGVTSIVLASHRPLERDPELLSARFGSRGIVARLVTPEYFRYLYTNDRFFAIAERLASTQIAPNTDRQPVAYKYSGMIWLSKFVPAMINWDPATLDPASQEGRGSRLALEGTRAQWYVTAAVILAALVLMGRRRPHFKRVVIVGLAGFVGMVLEAILILHYQVKSGVLFQNIGVLLMMFMAGLAVGAVSILHVARSSPESIGRRWGFGLLGGFAVLNAATALIVALGLPASLVTVSVAIFLDGFLVAGIFAYASLAGVRDQRSVVSPLYASDLLGGCLGSVLGSLLLIPFLGMGQAAVFMAGIALAGFLLVW